MFRWPWTSLQALNLDWILAKMKELIEKVDAYADNVTASATTGAAGTNASVTVTGDLDTGLSFDFTIPRGNTGPAGADGQDGAEGPEGPEGPPGESFKILGLVATTADLPSGAAQGDCYAVGTAASNSCYIWDGSAWVNIGNSMSVQRTAAQFTQPVSPSGYTIYYAYVIKNGDGSIDCYAKVFINNDYLGSSVYIGQFDWTTGIPYDVDLLADCDRVVFPSTFSLQGALATVGVSSADGIRLFLGSTTYPVIAGQLYEFYLHIPRGNNQME